jgi:hypothetical protein
MSVLSVTSLPDGQGLALVNTTDTVQSHVSDFPTNRDLGGRYGQGQRTAVFSQPRTQPKSVIDWRIGKRFAVVWISVLV